MSHRLRPDLGTAGKDFTVDREAASGIDAEIVGEFRVDHHFVTVFKRRHAVGVERVAAADEIARGNRLLTRSLVGHAGVVNAVEIIVLNQNIVARFPKLNCVAEPDE